MRWSNFAKNFARLPLRFWMNLVMSILKTIRCRLKSVRHEWNERFYDLIHAFYVLTGVPLLLNTSFNIMGKPIMHSVEDAVGLFYTTGLDALAIEDYLIEK